jgi:hypothetical protein
MTLVAYSSWNHCYLWTGARSILLLRGLEPHWYLFDKYDEKKDIFSFKAVGYSCSLDIGKSDSRVGIYAALKELYSSDPVLTLIEGNDFDDIDHGDVAAVNAPQGRQARNVNQLKVSPESVVENDRMPR